jgi:hypothetical protein
MQLYFFYVLYMSPYLFHSYDNLYSQFLSRLKIFMQSFHTNRHSRALHNTVAGDFHLYMKNMVCKRQDEGCHSQGASRNEFIVEK